MKPPLQPSWAGTGVSGGLHCNSSWRSAVVSNLDLSPRVGAALVWRSAEWQN